MWQSDRLNECQTAKTYMIKSPPWVKGYQMPDDLFPLYFLLFSLQGKYIKGHGPHLFSQLHSFSAVVFKLYKVRLHPIWTKFTTIILFLYILSQVEQQYLVVILPEATHTGLLLMPWLKQCYF